MSLRRHMVVSTPRPEVDTRSWVWSALNGLRELKVADTDMMAALLGKRKAEDPPPPPSREASSESNASDKSADAEDPIQMIVINFDGTMTRAKPFMRDPTLFEVSKGFITTESLRGFAEMTEEEHVANFGGAQDVAVLKEFFEECREAGIQIYVICDGKAKADPAKNKKTGSHRAKDAAGEAVGGERERHISEEGERSLQQHILVGTGLPLLHALEGSLLVQGAQPLGRSLAG